MDRKAYKVLIAVLVLLILLVLAAMGVIGYMLMTATVEELPQMAASPAPTATPRLLTSQDFEPDRSVLFTTPQGMLTDGQGNPLSLESLRGRETVLIFWSSWCGDCKEYLTGDFPQAAQAVRSSGAAVYLVCREGVKGDTREAAEAALSQQGLQETTLMDPDAALYTSLGLHWVPSVALLDAEGRVMYTAKGGLDAQEMSTLVSYAKSPDRQTLRFLESRLTMPSGLLASGYRVFDGQATPGETLLSESQSLLMLWAAQTGDQETFDRVWRAVRDGMSAGGLTAWRADGKLADVNASLDDLRMVEALALADARWGLYAHAAASRARTLYDRCVRNELMRDYAALKSKVVADTVTLCYMDAAAMDAAAAFDPRWAEAAQAARALLSAPESLISEALPLYHTRYDAKKKRYTGDVVQMNEACVAVLNAVRAEVVFPETLDWLENTLAAGPVYARYGADGKVLPGYDYESNATYALLVQIGAAAGRERMVQLALERMERRRSFDPAMPGGYGEATSQEHFTFDELEAMLAWAALDITK